MATTDQHLNPLLQTPVDVLLAIVEHLKLSDVLSLGLCCRKLFGLMKERSVWVDIVKEQRHHIPIPPELHLRAQDATDAFQNLSTDELFKLALREHRIDQLWPRPRLPATFSTLQRHSNTSVLLGMQMFLDRWLLLLYAEGVIQMYDTQNAVDKPRAIHFSIEPGGATRGPWSSFSAEVDPVNEILIIATARTVPPYLLNIFRVDLKDCADKEFKKESKFDLLKQISLDSPKTVQAVHPVLGVLAVSASSKVQLVSWLDPEVGSKGDFSIPAYPDNPDDLWDGINVVRFMGPYVLIARTRSIELHHFLSSLEPTTTRKLPPLKHRFRMIAFKEASFSNCKEGEPSGTGRNFEIIMLAYDVIQGLFQFKVELLVPRSPASSVGPDQGCPGALSLFDTDNYPRLSVTQIGLYPLGLPNSTPSYHHGPSVDRDSPTPTLSHTHFLQNIGHLAHGTSAGTSRGFISTFCMGGQGLRAVWVERRRGGVAREIQVWGRSMISDAWDRASGSWVSQIGADSVEMEKRVVFTINSYDLRDDIICCAFSESRGVIALGNRLGIVSILPLE